LDDLIDSIRRVDHLNSMSPSPELYKERLNLQVQYNLLSTNKTEWYLSRSKGYIYEHGEKAGRLLAYQLKSKAASQLTVYPKFITVIMV